MSVRRVQHFCISFVAMAAASAVGCGAGSADDTDATNSRSHASAELDRDLSLGSSGGDVQFVNDYLARYGYLPNVTLQAQYPAWRAPVKAAPAQADVYDDATAAGLRVFQANYGLPVTGIADAETRTILSRPRCSAPDNVARLDPADKFNVGPGPVPTSMTIRVLNAPSGMTLAAARSAIMAAATQWTFDTRYRFTQVTSGSANIMVDFNTVDCRSDATISGYAFAAPPPTSTIGSCITFNTNPSVVPAWSNATPTPGNALDLQSIATHELGHMLGIYHSGYSDAVMYPSGSFGAQKRTESYDDLNAGYITGVNWTEYDPGGGETDVDIDDGSLFFTRYVTAAPDVSGGQTVFSRTNSGGWVDMSQGGVGGVRISSDPSSGTFIVQDDGDIYKWAGGTSWTKWSGCAKDIAAGPDGSIWVLGCAETSTHDFPLYRWNGSSWVHDLISVNGVRVSVGKRLDTGRIVPWVVKADGSIYRRSANNTSSSASWNSVSASAAANDIAANASGYTWATTLGFPMVWSEQPAVATGPIIDNHDSAGGANATSQWFNVIGRTGDPVIFGVSIATSSGGTPDIADRDGNMWEAL